MDVTTVQAAKQLGLKDSRVRQLCIEGRIVGARKAGGTWFIPSPVQVVARGKK